MRKLMTSMLLLASVSASAAVATVQQVEPGVRPVYNSGTGVMPAGAQEAMPRAGRQLARDRTMGVGVTPAMLSLSSRRSRFLDRTSTSVGFGSTSYTADAATSTGSTLALWAWRTTMPTAGSRTCS